MIERVTRDALRSATLVLRAEIAAMGVRQSFNKLRLLAKFELERRHNPNWQSQPRVPRGQADGASGRQAGRNLPKWNRPTVRPICLSTVPRRGMEEMSLSSRSPNGSIGAPTLRCAYRPWAGSSTHMRQDCGSMIIGPTLRRTLTNQKRFKNFDRQPLSQRPAMMSITLWRKRRP